jgi:hypothetical protein
VGADDHSSTFKETEHPAVRDVFPNLIDLGFKALYDGLAWSGPSGLSQPFESIEETLPRPWVEFGDEVNHFARPSTVSA